ncbi:DUF3899 domain-containing protein [Peribacillus sp. SCS-37]|uniref:DUF3899 domain-containing protein n=1 Tax=Paraperibacillus esterisolvens TaxID=3115296 RepID=UPI00390659E7
MIKRSAIVFLAAILLSAVFAFFGAYKYSTSFLNALFFIGLFLVMAAAFLFVVEGGFFNGIIFSMKNFLKLDRLGAYVAQFDTEELDKTGYPVNRKYSLTLPFFLAGLLGCLISLLAVL